MVDEILRTMDSNERETIIPKEIVAHLNQFMTTISTEKLVKVDCKSNFQFARLTSGFPKVLQD